MSRVPAEYVYFTSSPCIVNVKLSQAWARTNMRACVLSAGTLDTAFFENNAAMMDLVKIDNPRMRMRD